MSKRAPAKAPVKAKPIIPAPVSSGTKPVSYIMSTTIHSNPDYIDHKGCSSLDKCIKVAVKKQKSKPKINYKKMFG